MSLSERIRLDVEAAPWVVEAIRKLEAENAELLAALKQVAVIGMPSTEEARAIGAKGGPVIEAERLAFEAWMQGHCWALCATWDGDAGTYRGAGEQVDRVDPHAMRTRELWAAWRDRAALACQGPIQWGSS